MSRSSLKFSTIRSSSISLFPRTLGSVVWMMISQPSSPVLKARRQSSKLYPSTLYSLLVFCLSVWLIKLLFFNGGSRTRVEGSALDRQKQMSRAENLEQHPLLKDTPPDAALFTPSHFKDTNSTHALTLAAILPVSPTTISQLDLHLHNLLGISDALVEIIILSPQTYHSRIRFALRDILSNYRHLGVELSIAHLFEGVDQGVSVIQAAQSTTTDWVLLTDEDGLMKMDVVTRDLLLMKTIPLTNIPIGSRGFQIHDNGASCVTSSLSAQPAAYLVPPFVLPASLLPSGPCSTATFLRDPWRALGDHVSRSKAGLRGGLVLGSTDSSVAWCRRYAPKDSNGSPLPLHEFTTNGAGDITSKVISTANTCPADISAVLIVVLFSDRSYIAPIACRLASQGHHITLLTWDGSSNSEIFPTMQFEQCRDAVINHVPVMSTRLVEPETGEEFLAHIPEDVEIVISAVEDERLSILLAALAAQSPHRPLADIRIPRNDIRYCDWMASLTLEEWKNWHVPHVELSVITDARPHSLRRLLSSLTRARYFGDTLNLRINVEQTADPETLRMVSDFVWKHGNVYLHHRVVHAGLMAAVVESWYPQGNDSYGLILEDDVELSPLFYAWTKMSLLRYRYGNTEDRSPHLFGISLYQQKNLELHPEGRHLFDARQAFASAGLANPSTPYLSQIPCSWGALYFPEHWREFHTYLPKRLAALAWPLAEPVVPAVRSNRWTRSWKKFFIELVFLRGYVMLYPNYADFVSLSTNHLETGSHVKEIPAEAYMRKMLLFNLPLMALPAVLSDGAPIPGTGLLELPDARLPDWTSLPVLDLLGTIIDEETIVRRGRERRLELTGCDGLPVQAYDVHDLLCIH